MDFDCLETITSHQWRFQGPMSSTSTQQRQPGLKPTAFLHTVSSSGWVAWDLGVIHVETWGVAARRQYLGISLLQWLSIVEQGRFARKVPLPNNWISEIQGQDAVVTNDKGCGSVWQRGPTSEGTVGWRPAVDTWKCSRSRHWILKLKSPTTDADGRVERQHGPF